MIRTLQLYEIDPNILSGMTYKEARLALVREYAI